MGGPVAGRPSLPGGPRCREALVVGRAWLREGKRLWGVPQDSLFWVDFFGNYDKDFGVLEIPKFWGLLSKTSGASSLLVAGRPSLPGGPRCREALIAGRPSLPGGPRCREVNLSLTGSPCKAFHYCKGPDPRLLRGGPSQGKFFVESLVGKLSLRRPSLPRRPSSLPGPSLPGRPRCRGPSLPGAPPCREALVAGRPSLPGVPCCREALVGQALVGGTPGFAILGRFLSKL